MLRIEPALKKKKQNLEFLNRNFKFETKNLLSFLLLAIIPLQNRQK